MKGLRSIPRILKINTIEGYIVSCLFNNGESRIIDFQQLFREVFNIQSTHPAYSLLEDLENNKSNIELFTLKKIIEAGLGKKLSIKIQ